VCGNLSTGDGGGIGHIGFSYNGAIEHNSILFNQSANPTIATNGGGILVMGARTPIRSARRPTRIAWSTHRSRRPTARVRAWSSTPT